MDLDRSVWAPLSLQHVTPHGRRVAPRAQGIVLPARGYQQPPARGLTRVGVAQEPRKLISRWHSEWHSDAPSAIDQSQRDASSRMSYFTFIFFRGRWHAEAQLLLEVARPRMVASIF